MLPLRCGETWTEIRKAEDIEHVQEQFFKLQTRHTYKKLIQFEYRIRTTKWRRINSKNLRNTEELV